MFVNFQNCDILQTLNMTIHTTLVVFCGVTSMYTTLLQGMLNYSYPYNLGIVVYKLRWLGIVAQ